MTRKRTPADFALWAALPMAHTSNVEKRLAMILDASRRRAFPRRFPAFALTGGAAVLVSMAMLHPVAQGQAPPPLAAQRQRANPSAKRHMSRETARVSAVSAVPGEFDAMQIEAEGRSLTPSAAAELERQLAARPDDYATHIRLLGYYGAGRFLSGLRRAAYDRQVFWLIRTHPESVLSGTPETMVLKRDDPAGFEEGKTLWLAQVTAHPGNTVILSKAADYCLLSDKGTAERLLRQAEALEPKNPIWPERLGHLYQLQGRNPTPQARLLGARKALAEYEDAVALSADKTLNSTTLPAMARAAFDTGEFEKARQYADALLRRGLGKNGESYESGYDIHEANMILGRLALHDGDVAQAEQHLLAMGRVADAPTLASFGPNMQLAQDLLKAGRRDAVLAYFDECAKFWQPNDHILATWKAQVQAGKTPDFRGNLVY